MAKYTITIADIDINIHTEETPEMVKTLVDTVDQRIRSLVKASPRLSKSEAAILCAVDYCAEHIKSDEKTRDMERDYVKLTKELEMLREEHARLLLADDEMRRENRILHDIIAKNVNTQKNAPTQGVQLSIETNPSNTTSATDVMFKDELDPNGPPRKVRRRPSPIKANTPANNKVGDMFDMLTFKDV